MKAVLDNHTTTSLIHDGSDEIDDNGGMEETNDVIPVNGKNPSKFRLCCYFKFCCHK